MINSTFTTESGRVVGVSEFGDPEAERTVVFFHPAPGASVFDPDPDATAERGVRVIAFDRPGYGVSEPMPAGAWASVAQAADDAAQYLRAHGIAEVGASGWSGGGRVALALAANRPELVSRVAVIATPAPDDEVPWHGDDANAMIDSVRGFAPEDAVETIAGQFSGMFGDELDPQVLLGALGASDADSAVLADDTARARITGMLQSSLAQGLYGMASDVAGYTLAPWGFEPADVAAKTLLLYGRDDPVAGNAHAQWWKGALPDARVEMVPDAGHLVIIPMWGRVLAHLTP